MSPRIKHYAPSSYRGLLDMSKYRKLHLPMTSYHLLSDSPPILLDEMSRYLSVVFLESPSAIASEHSSSMCAF